MEIIRTVYWTCMGLAIILTGIGWLIKEPQNTNYNKWYGITLTILLVTAAILGAIWTSNNESTI